MGECLGTLCYRLMSKRRQIVEKNLHIVASHENAITPSPQLTESIFQHNIANLVCSLKTYGMSPAKLSEYVEIQVDDAFREAIQKNTGAVLCLAHMGNWEILSKVSSLVTPEPKNFGAIYRPLDNKAADTYVVKQREKYNCKMFPKKTSMHKLSSFIREGGILGILADQNTGRSAKNNRPFFGVESTRSKLPAILHLRTQAPLFSVAVFSNEIGKWKIQISAIKLPDGELNTDQVMERITRAYESNFTQHIKDVFWFHRYWRVK